MTSAAVAALLLAVLAPAAAASNCPSAGDCSVAGEGCFYGSANSSEVAIVGRCPAGELCSCADAARVNFCVYESDCTGEAEYCVDMDQEEHTVSCPLGSSCACATQWKSLCGSSQCQVLNFCVSSTDCDGDAGEKCIDLEAEEESAEECSFGRSCACGARRIVSQVVESSVSSASSESTESEPSSGDPVATGSPLGSRAVAAGAGKPSPGGTDSKMELSSAGFGGVLAGCVFGSVALFAGGYCMCRVMRRHSGSATARDPSVI